ncbi:MULTISPECIES: ribosome maturation factor RimP [unclassified Crossiella]|uniref:ribosome maturation factor RimP n=1 Tax=Crossiella sp. CA-258035 TaxID=2981138 RepID=UPI0024BCBE18|nr:ribosome maturation factor RimP [Crossiella sp. CA-258035]WHT17927.1 ribosome maturation factor RimP [Crossiella sp. CA-258035]
MSSAPRDELVAQLEPLVRETVHEVGFELEELDIRQAGRRRLVRVVVDSDDGIGLDEIAKVSRSVSATLDAHDAILASAYTLEVTSPGIDRPLTHPRHWRRNRLRLVKVRPLEGAEYVGRVGPADEHDTGGVVLLVDGELRTVAYREMAKAVVEVEFRQPPAEDLIKLDRCQGTDASKEESK